MISDRILASSHRYRRNRSMRIGARGLGVCALLLAPSLAGAQAAVPSGSAPAPPPAPSATASPPTDAPPSGPPPLAPYGQGGPYGYAPAPYGYPPPPQGYYPPPGPWGAPGSQPPKPPGTLPYEEGQPIPPGYALEQRPLIGLSIAGAAALGVLWIASIGIGVVGENEVADERRSREAAESSPYPRQYHCNEHSDTDLLSLCADDVMWPMALPVVGPFVTIGTAHAEGAGVAVLLLDGIVQTGGLAMLIAGLAVRRDVLVLQTSGEAGLRISPTLGPTGAGFGLRADL
jgi:hypothetical protein